jgi:hypothetical protein
MIISGQLVGHDHGTDSVSPRCRAPSRDTDVSQVLAHLAVNSDLDELFAAYPRLTVEDVKPVLAYAYEAVEIQRTRAGRKAASVAAQAPPTSRC